MDTQQKILIVDDQIINRLLLTNYCKKIIWIKQEIFEAQNWLEAINISNKYREKIGLIIMDFRMPLMDWITATANIRKTYKWAIVWYTSDQTQNIIESFIDAWADAVYIKPDWMERLLEFIKQKFTQIK